MVSESLKTIFGVKILKFFDSDPGSGMEKIGSGMEKSRIRDGKKLGFGMEKIRIRDGKNSDRRSGINIPFPQHYSEGQILFRGSNCD
jgi:hypothetical protein